MDFFDDVFAFFTDLFDQIIMFFEELFGGLF